MTATPVRLLIVDDEAAFRRAMRTSLAPAGFLVEEAADGEQALRILRQAAFDLVLLDINMPGRSGIEICGRIRESNDRLGIVMLTVRDAEEDKVRALEAGADDFITKPFRLRELLARLRAVLRRIRVAGGPERVVTAGALEIDLEKRLLRKEGREVHLSPIEFDLLAFLVRQDGAPVPHAKLLRAVWGPDYGGELEYLRSYVRMLRKKIENDPAHPEYILTEPWLGYRFRNPSDPDQQPE